MGRKTRRSCLRCEMERIEIRGDKGNERSRKSGMKVQEFEP